MLLYEPVGKESLHFRDAFEKIHFGKVFFTKVAVIVIVFFIWFDYHVHDNEVD